MKNISKIIFLAAVVSFVFAACKKIDKADTLSFHNAGSDVVLTSSAATVAPDRADSGKIALSFNWTDPKYSVDSAHTKFVLQIDTPGGNFMAPYTKEIIGNLTTSFLAKELNAVWIAFGLRANTPHTINTRLVSSYLNNNDQKISNVVTIQATPYAVPPKVEPPASRTLALVGSSTAAGWDNPVAQGQLFTMIDTVTYEGTFFINAGGEYLLLPLNGNWDHKYNVADKTAPGLKAGGDFGKDMGNDNIPGPDVSGYYKIRVDFQNGKYTVTKAGDYGLLYMPGDYQGWGPEKTSAINLGSPAADGKFDGFVNIPAGGTNEFKFTTTPDWSNAYGPGANAGDLEGGAPGNLTVPAAGYYYFTANMNTLTWTYKEITSVSLIGSFAASGWNTDVPMTYDAGADKWTGTITIADGDQFKFRFNNDWGLNLGDNDGSGRLLQGGENIGNAAKNFAVPAGTHKITLYLGAPGYYTYKIE
ncbi:MAG: SusE domain-containing protein [Ferruginibacter sp.]